MTAPAPIGSPVLLDFESRSRADLRRVGGRRYWEHSSSEALCCAWYDTSDGTTGVWTPRDAWPRPARILAAHNAHGFDRFAAEKYAFDAAGWIDTAHLARKAGLPGALDALGTRWADVPKDREASLLTRRLSSVRRPSRKHGPAEIKASVWRTLDAQAKRDYGLLPEITQEIWTRVVRYCQLDVAILAENWPRLSEWLSVDADVERVDRVINDRGVCFDADLAQRLISEDARVSRVAVAEAAAALGMTPDECATAARSPAQFTAATGSSDARGDTVATIDHPLARAREALATIAAGKLRAGLDRVHADGRLRDTLVYYGAHTGRWAGRGMQLHNMPRPAARLEGVDVDALSAAVLAGRPCDADEIALLVRATITASPGNVLAVADFSSVEARATAWAAGDRDAVAVFVSGKDPYKVAASAIFGVEYDAVTKPQRQVGKVAELACLAGDVPVLTSRGWVPLQDVKKEDRLWDGISWVRHEGVVTRGSKPTIEVAGIKCTSDHRILCDQYRWTQAGDMSDLSLSQALAIASESLPSFDATRALRAEPRSISCELVFDVAHAGPRNRYTILTARGPLIVHNCGYQGGPGAFESMARAYRLDLDGVDVGAIVTAWRELHAPIKRLWYACGNAFASAARDGRTTRVGPFEFVPGTSGEVACFLPSGRPVVYNDATVDDAGGLAYTGRARAHIYGGKIVENAVQALCRDLMAEALLRAEDAGLNPVLTVHDEIVCDVPEAQGPAAFARLLEIMRTPPAWARGFPLGADGWTGRRYRK